MLGSRILDPNGVEEGGSIRGMELLASSTTLEQEKKRCQVEGVLETLEGALAAISGCAFRGYEIHMGKTMSADDVLIGAENMQSEEVDRVVVGGKNQNIYGSYVHGLFDNGNMANAIVQTLAKKKGITIEEGVFEDYQSFKEKQYDKLADTLRQYLNMEEIYGMLRDARLE